MKYGNKNYMQLSRRIFNDPKYSVLSNGAKWLFVVLNELEQQFCSSEVDFFYRSDADLATDAGIGITKLKNDKAELKKTDLIYTWQMHWRTEKTNKCSEKHITAYRILR